MFLTIASHGHLNMDKALNHLHPLGMSLYEMKKPLKRNWKASRAVPSPLPCSAR